VPGAARTAAFHAAVLRALARSPIVSEETLAAHRVDLCTSDREQGASFKQYPRTKPLAGTGSEERHSRRPCSVYERQR
jgi:hypothetical protein